MVATVRHKTIRSTYMCPRHEVVIYPGRNPIFFNPYISKDDSVLSVGRLVDAGEQVFLLTQHAHPFAVCIVGAEETVPVPRIPIRADVKVSIDQHCVAILGPPTEARLRGAHSRAAVYAATPRYEPLGMAALDAAFSRCAIVANDIPSFREVWAMPPSTSAPTTSVMEYLHDCLYGTRHRGELMRQALTEMNWRQIGVLNVLDGRRYFYKGFKNRVALDGSFSSYEYIHDALFRLQVGYDKKKIDMGIVMVTAQRSEKSKLGTTKDLVSQEIEMLHPTINLPVTIVLFDLGRPGELYEENKQQQEGLCRIRLFSIRTRD